MTENKAMKPAETSSKESAGAPLTAGGEFRKSLDSFEVPPVVPVRTTMSQLNSEAPSQIND